MTIKNKITISHKRLPEDESTDSTDTGFTHHDRLINNEASRNLKITGIIPENTQGTISIRDCEEEDTEGEEKDHLSNNQLAS